MCLQLHARTREVGKRMSELLATLGGLARPIAQRRDPMILSAIHFDQVILCIVDGEHATPEHTPGGGNLPLVITQNGVR